MSLARQDGGKGCKGHQIKSCASGEKQTLGILSPVASIPTALVITTVFQVRTGKWSSGWKYNYLLSDGCSSVTTAATLLSNFRFLSVLRVVILNACESENLVRQRDSSRVSWYKLS